MKACLITVFVFLALLVCGYVGLGIWTEAKHDKTAYQWIKDEIQAHDDKQVDEEIKIENADGTVEATAVINF